MTQRKIQLEQPNAPLIINLHDSLKERVNKKNIASKIMWLQSYIKIHKEVSEKIILCIWSTEFLEDAGTEVLDWTARYLPLKELYGMALGPNKWFNFERVINHQITYNYLIVSSATQPKSFTNINQVCRFYNTIQPVVRATQILSSVTRNTD